MTISQSGPPVRDITRYEPVAAFTAYAEAQEVVDALSDRHFPVENTLIVGVDLRLVERVLGRLNYGRAAAMGAATGAWFGLLIGLFFAIFTPDLSNSLGVILWGLVWGAVAGALFGLFSYALTSGRRDFYSQSGLEAGRYEVLVHPDHVAEARRLLESRRSDAG
ncbi:hypothetical protein J4573_16115 [Actinomadura barringtoniae]|uniref:General stress protein 17M-like domain-containing protein n=1 Tax=Actinomadura barringtoniae TaxID=1427535 RepID=A0A939T3U8_9ACTN|nr:general stress protein [Actinomadura barringtoniae]MBO2448628.1 hypothetical protein [Actinomadura barringtoniae]